MCHFILLYYLLYLFSSQLSQLAQFLVSEREGLIPYEFLFLSLIFACVNKVVLLQTVGTESMM